MSALALVLPGIRWIWLGLLALILAGCATTPRIDWDSRVGNYTYDQAVIEMGPPDKSAKLTDGTMVAEWLTYRREPTAYVQPYPFYSRGYLYPYAHPYASYSYVQSYPGYESYIRLTFGPDGVLRTWKKLTDY